MNDHSGIWQVVRDNTGYYRATPNRIELIPNEVSVARDLSYIDACKLGNELYEIEQVMDS